MGRGEEKNVVGLGVFSLGLPNSFLPFAFGWEDGKVKRWKTYFFWLRRKMRRWKIKLV